MYVLWVAEIKKCVCQKTWLHDGLAGGMHNNPLDQCCLDSSGHHRLSIISRWIHFDQHSAASDGRTDGRRIVAYTALCTCVICASCSKKHTLLLDAYAHSRPISCHRLTRATSCLICIVLYTKGGSVAEWLACWTQAQKGLGSNCSRDAVG